jgi:class 3 adenylate cyclase/tetratricopeptide (TPR) repeat protein
MPSDPQLFDSMCPSCGSHVRLPDGRCAGCMADFAGACPDCGASTLRHAKFCWRCGVGLLAETVREPAHAAIARRPVTVMFSDLVGSAALSTAMDPEDLAELLGRCHSLVTKIVTEHHGFTGGYMGDGTLAYFGYPQAGENDAVRAVQAALAVLRSIPTIMVLDRPMQVRIGIATGIVVAGDVVGIRGPRGLDLAGQVPNLAARLQSIADPNSLIVDEATYDLGRRSFEFEALGGVPLKGWREPVCVWRVLRSVEEDEALGGRLDASTPLVGRHGEVAHLAALWRQTAAGNGRAVVLVGEMGIGKSRLIDELLRKIADTRHVRHRWFSSRYMQGVVLHPIVQQIERAAGIVAEDTQPARRDKLGAYLSDQPDLARALIAELVAPGNVPPEVAGLPPNKRRELTLDALLDLTRSQAAKLPILAVFEDYHWADPTSRELLERAAQSVQSMDGLLIVTVRPGSEPAWTDQVGAERIELEALNPVESRQLAEAVAGVSLTPDTLRDIVARCDGVPLFIEEVTRAAIEDSAATAVQTAAGRPMPLSIHGSLNARLDNLGAAREAAEVASVIGREFAPELLSRAMDRPAEAIRFDINRMLESGLIQTNRKGVAASFRFKHALIQDAAYNGMVRARRRSLHGRVAKTICDLAPAEAEANPQLLATHFTEAGEIEPAVTWWLAAGVRSLRQSAITEGLEQLDKGLALLETQQDSLWRRQTEMSLLISKAKAHVATSGHASDPVGDNFRRARVLCDTLPGSPQRLTVTFGEWSHYVTRGPLRSAARLAQELRLLGEQSGDRLHQLYGSYSSGLTDTVMGRFAQARYFLEQGLTTCAVLGSASYTGSAVGDPNAIMLAYLALIELCEGQLEKCRRNVVAALQAARETKLTYSIALAMLVRLTVTAFDGAPDQGDADLDDLRDFARTHDMAFFGSIEICMRGWAYARRGNHDAGLALLEDGLAKYLSTQSGVWLWTFLRMKAEVLGWKGDIDAAFAALDEAYAVAARVDAEFDTPVFDRVRGELLAHAGRCDAALAALARAEARAKALGSHLFAQQAAEARSRLFGSGQFQAEGLEMAEGFVAVESLA